MQLTMFGGHEKFTINKPIRLIELFAGYGSQALALKYLGVDFEHWRICEWAVKSIQAYKDMHFKNDNTDYSKNLTQQELIDYLTNKGISANYNEPMTRQQIERLGEQKQRQIYNNIQATHNLVNIQQAKASDFNIVDTDKYCYIMTYSYPCGLAGTKIITENGYKNIEDIREDDFVLTHNNRFCKVNKIMNRVSNHYYNIKGLGVPELLLTEEHPLYVLRNGKTQWVKVKDLKTTDMFAFNKNSNNIDRQLSNELLWLLGRYVADGYINKYLNNSVEFAIGYNKEQEFLNNIPKEYLKMFKKYNKSCIEYRIADRNLQNLCREFGIGAANKKIPQWVIDLPNNKLQSFFDGYISGDGHIRYIKNIKQIMFSTVSKELFLGMQQIIIKLYNCVCSCSIRKDNRKVTFNDSYNCQFNLTNNHKDQVLTDNKIYTKIKSIVRYNENVEVYNFEVDNDNSYTCENVIVHNCQDVSSAGKGAGMAKGSNTRSGMLWEVERILDECDNLPQVLLMENVPEVIGTKNIRHFASWLEKLESLGYKCYWQILNGKDYGVPQNRERCFMVSILGDYLYEFPEKIKLEHKLNDLLEKNVDEKYYLTDKQLVYAFDCNRVCDNTKRGDLADRKVNPSIAKTISCRGAESQRADITNFVIDDNEKEYTLGEIREEINLKRQLFNKLIEKNALKENDIVMHNYTSRRLNDLKMNKPVVKFNNISPTLDTSCGDCIGVVHNHRIRKLTAKECFRLMGVKDEDFENVAKNQSNASLYHLSGDSIIVQTLCAIFKQML